MTRRALVLLGVGMLGSAAVLSGQETWERRVHDQLNNVGAFLRDQGFLLTHEIYEGSLHAASRGDFWVQLDEGLEYALMGVCDEHCDDIDLELFDSDSVSIDADYQVDDAPIVRIIPPSAGRYRVHVYLAGCALEECHYGVGVYGRSADNNNTWEAQVKQQITDVARQLEEEGYNETHEPRIGALDDGDSEDFLLRMRSGMIYSVVGVCDNDCSDIDLVVYDENDKELDADDRDDNIPVLAISPRVTGRFRVRVSMDDCSTEPCYYGVGVYGRRGTLD